MPSTTRKRDMPGQSWTGTTTGSDNGNAIKPARASGRAKVGTQITVSEGHPFSSRTRGDRRDIGGNFFTTRSYMQPFAASRSMSVSANVSGIRRSRTYVGPILPVDPTTVPFPSSIASNSVTLANLGATAVARCKPTNSVANLATALGELYKEGLPNLVGSSTWKDRTHKAKTGADEFLNVEFGWLPLVNEVTSVASGVTRADAILRQYERDAGKVVRRRYNFPIQRETKVEDYGSDFTTAWFNPTDSTFEQGPRGRGMLKKESFRRQWFSGAFTYALPSGYDSRNKQDRLNLLAQEVLGLELTPDTLWNIAPWSWAVDWFSNTGDVISNISDWSTDGLVMLYGYMMEHTIVKHTYTKPNSGLLNGKVAPSPLVLVTETKQRVGANPFGFGLTWEGLSPIQKAIAAAVGITRLT